MQARDFIDRAIEQDSRNIFEKGQAVKNVPDVLSALYIEGNPVDVEVNIKGANTRFIPIEELSDYQEDYQLEDGKFVFATCDGDPIFIYNNAVFTNAHGANGLSDEKLANSLCDYLDGIS